MAPTVAASHTNRIFNNPENDNTITEPDTSLQASSQSQHQPFCTVEFIDSHSKKAYNVDIKAAKKANPLTSDVILATNSSQATLMYFIVFTQAVIEGLHTLKCQEIFIDKLAKNKDIVGDTGDTGYNPCKKKAKQLKLADKVGGKSVDSQYKDPGTTYRLWGSEHHAAKGIVFYEIHSLVNKQNAAGQNYSVLSTATSNP